MMLLAGAVSHTVTASTNNYDISNSDVADVWRLSSTGAWNITGIAAKYRGRVVTLVMVSGSLTLKNNDAASDAGNRFALTSDLTLAAGDVVMIWYDVTSAAWRALVPRPSVATMAYSTQGGNFNAAVNNGYVITANCTATLPSTATRGDKIAFYIRDGVTSFVVGRNTRDIQNVAEDMTVDIAPTSFTLVFDDTTNGWWLE